MAFGDWFIYCIAGNERLIQTRMCTGVVPGKSDNESFTSGYLNKCLGRKEHT